MFETPIVAAARIVPRGAPARLACSWLPVPGGGLACRWAPRDPSDHARSLSA